MVNLPSESAASAARREALAKDWLDASGVAHLLRVTQAEVDHLRREGHVLAAWAPNQGGYRFPLWQFSEGTVIPQMRKLLAILRGPRGVAPGQRTSGWEELEWLLAPNALLNKQCPAVRLPKDHGYVIAAAREQFGEDPNAGW